MDPATIAILMAVGSSLKAISQHVGASKQSKIEKKKLKETKRKTFSDLLNDSMNRSHDTEQSNRRSQNELTAARAKALQDSASGIRQSLIR